MEIRHYRGMIGSARIKIVEKFKHLGSSLSNQNSNQDEIKCGLKAGNACY